MTTAEPNKRLIRDLKWATRWEQAGQRGRWHFLWIHGVLGWGVPFATSMTPLDWWRQWRDAGTLPPMTQVAITFAISMVSGLIWGAWMWRHFERRFLRITAERDGPTARIFE
jgi:hypothetical protein